MISLLGDLTQDMHDDPDFPKAAIPLSAIGNYLNKNACLEALEALDDAYEEHGKLT